MRLNASLRIKNIMPGIMNIGNRPTIGINQNESIEIHLFNFNKTIYGETLKVDVIKKIREEQNSKTSKRSKVKLLKIALRQIKS